jgi:hypothetical protein
MSGMMYLMLTVVISGNELQDFLEFSFSCFSWGLSEGLQHSCTRPVCSPGSVSLEDDLDSDHPKH